MIRGKPFKKGNTPWSKINNYSKETRKKMRDAHLGKKLSDFHRSKISNSRKGVKHSEETKERISKSIMGKNKGKKPWNYIDGRSKFLGPARYGDDWDAIRYLVYFRDKFTCQDCGIKDRLDIHHIVPFLISNDNSLINLVALCRKCHMKRDREYNHINVRRYKSK